MEQQWPTKFQQSGASKVDEIDTVMNSNNSTDNSLGIVDNKSCNNEDKCDRNVRLQQKFENEISEKSRSKIQTILNDVNVLSPIEKLLLYLKLPTECKESIDPLRQPLNPLGSRSEISQTIMWIKTHLEEDPDISLQKKGVYEEYQAFCNQNSIKHLSTADFGKVMKQVYPKVRPRRLGTRGNSQYCYSGLRKRIKLSSPLLPDLSDNPQSTEFQSHSSDLMAAAWIIIKEWSECQLGIKFESLLALAYHLVTKSSIGVGTKSAALISENVEKQMKAETLTSYSSKHKEMTLQLQRKLQQKSEVIKEQKRKLQSPRCDLKSRKKCKGQQMSTSLTSSPTAANSNNNNNNNSNEINNTSPSQGLQTVCDKSQDFTNLQTLPDFSSFQKPVKEMGNSCDVTVRDDNGYGNNNNNNVDDVSQQQQQQQQQQTPKVAIPRLITKQSPVPSPRRGRNAKYKAIQPKPEPCDIAYNPTLTNVQSTGDNRSQEENKKSVKQMKDEEMYIASPLNDDQSVILSRERLISVSKVSKDALDGYLGTENSQEHEEELMKYFDNNNTQHDPDTHKLSQLRQLLEQNQFSQQTDTKTNVTGPYRPNYVPKVELNQFNLQQNVKRRVSFDTTQLHDEPVPPSPNTRRKHFNFTPISPGPHSPNGRQSKCSSTNASPFVSPRNTPVPRARVNSHPYQTQRKIKNIRIKPDVELGIDYKPQTVISAPPSPKTNVLQDLLQNKLPSYQGGEYVAPLQQNSLSTEVSLLLANNINDGPNPPETTYRSQSVPVRTIYGIDQYNFESQQQNEYNVIDVNKFIETAAPLVIENNEIDFDDFNKQPLTRWGNRSQSFDYDTVTKCPPQSYRSVPSTPIPHAHSQIEPIDKNFTNNHHHHHQHQSSRSYPSTPLTNESFAFNPSHDYLLNGQPIKEKQQPSSVELNQINYLQTDNYNEIFNEPVDGLIDNKNYNFDGQINDNYETKSINLVDENCDIIGTDYFKSVPDVNGS